MRIYVDTAFDRSPATAAAAARRHTYDYLLLMSCQTPWREPAAAAEMAKVASWFESIFPDPELRRAYISFLEHAGAQERRARRGTRQGRKGGAFGAQGTRGAQGSTPGTRGAQGRGRREDAPVTRKTSQLLQDPGKIPGRELVLYSSFFAWYS